jgi:hypothetical protein
VTQQCESVFSLVELGTAQLKINDDVENGLKKVKVKGWIGKTRNREQWRPVVEEEKAHPGL